MEDQHGREYFARAVVFAVYGAAGLGEDCF